MILRPLQPAPRGSEEYLAAWPVVERIEKQKYDSCWLITQPSHAALAAELAARLSAPQFPKPDPQMIQAIALHDAGWGVPDAHSVQKSRSSGRYHPESFLDMPASQLVSIWQDSIDTAKSASAAGGYAVSRHFDRIARQRIATGSDSPQERRKLESFVSAETQRQKKLAAKQPLSIEELERLADLLQFVDLLSLYFCSGASENVIFPEYFGLRVQILNKPEGFRFTPQIFEQGTQW
ncbi:MAG: DUF3891 family protein, partial [Acidobacteriia bacterium]|nr:DUF3891 family protein [Terriglobia bacterium]